VLNLFHETGLPPIAVPEGGIMQTKEGLMVIVQPVPTAPLASVTLIVNVPGAVGVPLMAPVEVFRVRPAGSVPLLTENV